MKTLLYTALLFLVVIPLSGGNIDTRHLKISVSFDFLKRQAIGSAEITASVLTQSQKIILDAGNLSVFKTTSNNKNLNYTYDGGDAASNLVIELDRIYEPSEIFTVTISYATNHENRSDPFSIGGSFGKGLRFLLPSKTTPTRRHQIWSCGEPQSNKYWFPCNDEISDIHTTEIFATVDKPYTAICSGNLVETKENADGTRTFHYQSDVAFPNYLTFIALGEYTDFVQHYGPVNIHHFGYPNEKEALEATVELLPDMMAFMEKQTDFLYPMKSYHQVVVQDYPFPGLIGQHGGAILSDNYIDDYGVHQDFKYLWDGVAIQSLANQWFGNVIMPASWRDSWINYAFSQYFAGQYTSKCFGNEEYLLWYYPFEKSIVTTDWQNGIRLPVVPEKINDVNEFAGNNQSKYRGTLILRMLQAELGEQNWSGVIQYFIKNYAYKQVTTKDFQNVVEKISGKSYDWFFRQWFYQTGWPSFAIEKKYDDENKQLNIRILQNVIPVNHSDYPQTSYFEGKMIIETDVSFDTISLKPQAENIFHIQTVQNPGFVNVNFQQTFLCDIVFDKTVEEYLAQLENSKDVTAKQEALFHLVTIANESTTENSTKIQIRRAFEREITSDQYWRYKMSALNSLSKICSLPYDTNMIKLLKNLIKNEKSWLKSTAIQILGNSQNPDYTGIYTDALKDSSDRVINAAAIALGKSRSPLAFELLMNLEKQPSWKNQNRISALKGLEHLGDVRAADYALQCIKDNLSPRWYLATPTWDYPFAAVQTLVALGKGEYAFPVLYERLEQSLNDNDLNDIFQHVQLINLLLDKRAEKMYQLLHRHFGGDEKVLEAVTYYESQFLQNFK